MQFISILFLFFVAIRTINSFPALEINNQGNLHFQERSVPMPRDTSTVPTPYSVAYLTIGSNFYNGVVNYEIRNFDGIANDVEVYITVRELAEFINLPKECDEIKKTSVVCAFGTINKNEIKSFTITVDNSAMRGSNESRIEAQIYTSSYNMNKGSNKDTLYIPLNAAPIDDGESEMFPKWFYLLLVVIAVLVLVLFLCGYFLYWKPRTGSYTNKVEMTDRTSELKLQQ